MAGVENGSAKKSCSRVQTPVTMNNASIMVCNC